MASNKITDILIAFNKKATLLIDELSRIFPDSIIALNSKDLKKMTLNDSCILINFFVINVLPDKEKIYAKDVNYFKSVKYETKYKIDKDESLIIDQLRKLWDKLSPQNQNHLFDYLIYLCKKTDIYFDNIYLNKN